MNFDRSTGFWNMPELGSPYSYVVVWLAMVGIAAGMLAYFRRKGWILKNAVAASKSLP